MNDDAGVQGRLDDLERRLAAAEDLLSIYRFVASYGPSVDSNSLGPAVSMWTGTGAYDLDVGRWEGEEQLRALFEGGIHQGLVAGGCAHIVSTPRITIDGDTAIVTCYQQMVRNVGGGFEIARLSANRWELVRGDDGWAIQTRISRRLDGDPRARSVLAHGL